MRGFFIVCAVMFIAACHPLSMFRPNAIKPLAKSVQASIEVAVDNYGIPAIRAQNIHDAYYGLGFMHARDRLFQLDVMRHAALGRTAELFGERTIDFDRRLRILTYKLDDQLKNISQEEDALLTHYVRGVNDGAKARGRTAEHFFLGVSFEELTKRDVLAIARLQSWLQGSDLFAELARLKIARSTMPLDTKFEFLSALDDRGAAIIAGRTTDSMVENFLPAYLKGMRKNASGDHKKISEDNMVQIEGGASNAWVVSGSKSKDGHAILMNDPHLQHFWPSNFYLSTLFINDDFLSGASFVGLPAILIGSSKSLSWGITASYLNTQDSVLLSVVQSEPGVYLVDGRKHHFKEWPQQYCLDKKGTCSESMHYVSIFGPVIENRMEKWVEESDYLAVQWTGFYVDLHSAIGLPFVKLAQANDVREGVKIVQGMTLPGVNVVLADRAGEVAYSYAGLVPRRDPTQNPYLPLDGKVSSSLWAGFLETKSKPAIINPDDGFIVTANQNIFEKNAPLDLVFGKQGAPPYRALRIKERIATLLEKNQTIDFDELSSVQLDNTSREAEELACLIGRVCEEQFKDESRSKKEFANAVARFDGRYTISSMGALPYEILMREIITSRFSYVIPSSLPEGMAYMSQLRYAVKNALLKELRGEKTAIFASDQSLLDGKKLVQAACEPAYEKLVEKASSSSWKWRWGRHHYLRRKGLLGEASLIGSFFRDKRREVAGVQSAPMAEAGIPVSYGANLRLRVKMTTPPEMYVVLDSGNSGTIGSKNAFDQASLWHEGKSIKMSTSFQNALENASTVFSLARENGAQ